MVSSLAGFLLLVICVSSTVVSSIEPVIKLPNGDVKGTFELLRSNSEIKYSSFKGIPYAEAPIDSLRFKAPVRHGKWSTVKDATNYGAECPQWGLDDKTIGAENCLFLNVFTPYIPSASGPKNFYPVMVFIHGGKFQRGSSNLYGPERFVEQGIVLVTFNYRLGVLGFLSTDDTACPGNLGLKDQVMALTWVQENIRAFAGDPDMVTIFGQDAGAVSVFLHILSPMSNGLFLRAITQSGTPLCDWAMEEHPYSFAVEVAQHLRCTTKSSSAMIDCMRKKPLKDILNAQKSNKTFGDYPLRAMPVVEKEGFLPDRPTELLNSAKFQVPLLSGVNRDDGSFFYPLINSYSEQLRKNSSFLSAQLIPMFLLTVTDIRGNIESVSQAIMFDYFNGVDTTDVMQVMQPFINVSTNSMFLSCHYKTVESYSLTGANVYMYAFEYDGENSMLSLEYRDAANYQDHAIKNNVKVNITYNGRIDDFAIFFEIVSGVSHGDELLYLFKIKDAELSTSKDILMSNRLLHLWTTFALKGIPQSTVSLEYPKWEPYTTEFKNYYAIDSKITTEVSYKQRYVDLWLDHLPTLAKIRPRGNQDIDYKTGAFGWTMFAVALILLTVSVVLAVMLYRKSKSQYFKAAKAENK